MTKPRVIAHTSTEEGKSIHKMIKSAKRQKKRIAMTVKLTLVKECPRVSDELGFMGMSRQVQGERGAGPGAHDLFRSVCGVLWGSWAKARLAN